MNNILLFLSDNTFMGKLESNDTPLPGDIVNFYVNGCKLTLKVLHREFSNKSTNNIKLIVSKNK